MLMADFELHAFIEDDGTRKSFYLRISEPSKVTDNEDYFCRIHAPDLLRDDRDIFGVDEEQAIVLAFDFIRFPLDNKRLVSENGEVIRLEGTVTLSRHSAH